MNKMQKTAHINGEENGSRFRGNGCRHLNSLTEKETYYETVEKMDHGSPAGFVCDCCGSLRRQKQTTENTQKTESTTDNNQETGTTDRNETNDNTDNGDTNANRQDDDGVVEDIGEDLKEGAEDIGDDLTGRDNNTNSVTDNTTDDTNDTDNGANTETRTGETKTTER